MRSIPDRASLALFLLLFLRASFDPGHCLDIYRDGSNIHACGCHTDVNQRWTPLASGQIASVFRPDLCVNDGTGSSSLMVWDNDQQRRRETGRDERRGRKAGERVGWGRGWGKKDGGKAGGRREEGGTEGRGRHGGKRERRREEGEGPFCAQSPHTTPP